MKYNLIVSRRLSLPLDELLGAQSLVALYIIAKGRRG